jgi:hypothetical protein
MLVGKQEGKKPLGRLWHRWADNIKMDLTKWDGRMWNGLIGSGSGAVAASCEHMNEPSRSTECWEFIINYYY